MDDIQGVNETDPIRINAYLASSFMHQEADRVVSDQQAIHLLDHTDGFQAAGEQLTEIEDMT